MGQLDIAFVIKALAAGAGGGAERTLSVIASALAQRGHGISVVTFDTEDGSDFYNLSKNINRVKLSHARSLDRLRILRRTISSLRPDVAVGFMHSSFIPLGVALIGTDIPVVASERTSYPHYLRHPFQNLMLHATVPLFARMTANLENVRAGFPRSIQRQMTVIPNPVAGARSMADPTGGHSKKTLLCVGGFRREKDHEILIRAFARIAYSHRDWTLRLVGDGELGNDLRNLSQQVGIASQVQFAGTTDRIESEYVGAQLFALPSRYEAFPNCLAEALAHGLPAIGFADCPGTRDMIRDGVNGMLVGGKDRIAALSIGLDHLLKSDRARVELGSRAPGSVASFSLASITDLWESFLKSTVSPSNLRRAMLA